MRKAEPDWRWQRSHWQSPVVVGSPSYRYCTAPHKQRPVPPPNVDLVIDGPPLVSLSLPAARLASGSNRSRRLWWHADGFAYAYATPTDCSAETRARPSSSFLPDAPIGVDTVAR